MRPLIAAFVLVTLAFGPAARAAEKPRARVLLVGVDAGEWSVLGPLMDQGKCPNFARIRAEGSAGKLRSFVPLLRSPVIWASIATGKSPEKHGITDFFARKPGAIEDTEAEGEGAAKAQPMTSNLWKARPVWGILSGLGRTVGVVGWWTTWPAQPVNGFLVSDYVGYEGKWAKGGSKRTYPEDLITTAGSLRRTPESVSWAELFQFVAPIDTTNVTPRQRKLVNNLRWIYAGDMTFYRIALELYRQKRPEFFSVYFRGVDEVSHSYWDLDQSSNAPLTKAEIAWLKPLIPNYYVFTDRLLGGLLQEVGKGADVVICSDHGFGGGGEGVNAHKPDGIIFMRGPHVAKGATITGATVLDITPTVLAMMGLPTARDMDGRLISGLKPALVKRMERETRLPTYESARAQGKSEEPLRSPVDEELRERLRSLGYIQ